MSKELAAGQKIQTYEVVSLLGRGGMSRVYLCEDLVLNRRVALKQLLTSDHDSRSVIRLQQEGQSLARLSHPNIVKILTYFNDDDGAQYLVMELLHGCSLAELLAVNGSLGVGDVLKLAEQLCDALQHAHDQGIVHRDIKPTNIFLCNKKIENVKIIDFGIAKIADNSINATRTGEFVGSPAYISPEQALQKDVTVKSDQYSLGCVLYECLAGHPPFEDQTAMGLILKHINDQPEPLGKNLFVPAAVAKTIDRALRKDPEARFASMTEFKQALSGAVPAKSTTLNPAVILGAIAVAIVGGGMFFILMIMKAPTPASSLTPLSTVSPTPNLPPARNIKNAIAGTSEDSLYPSLGDLKIDGFKDEQRVEQELRRNPQKDTVFLNRYAITDHSLSMLARAPNLKKINMDSSRVDDSAGNYLAKIPTLEVIEASKTNLGDAFVAPLSKLPKLHRLALCETQVSSEGLKPLVKNHSLAELLLRCCERIDDRAGSVIAQMPALQMLDASKCSEISDKFVADLGKMPNLNFIAIGETGITSKSLPVLAKMKSLKRIYLDNVEKITDISDLQHLDLDTLSLRNCDINEKIVRQLVKFPHLKLLRLDRAAVTDDDLKVLATAPMLSDLQITNCQLLTQKGINDFHRRKPNCLVNTTQDRYAKLESMF
ncbi:MAG TPA: protein kinase [Drouetiella sp.]